MEKVSNLVVARFESSSLKNYLKTKLAETNELKRLILITSAVVQSKP